MPAACRRSKDARVRASKVLHGPDGQVQRATARSSSKHVRQALYASKICSYAQGFVQMQAAAKEHDWPLNFGNIALLWRGGCIIRARFLDRIKEAFDADAKLENLLLAPYFTEAVEKAQDRLAARRGHGGRAGRAGAGLHHGPDLFRRLSQRPVAGQPAASAARLLRRAHLRPRRPAGHVPHRLAAACAGRRKIDQPLPTPRID